MSRRGVRRLLASGTTAALMLPVAAVAAVAAGGGAGSAGIGDPYYPKYGNGGYDVMHYGISVGYSPKGDRLRGTTVVSARATQKLTRFDLDLVLRARSVQVNGQRARFTQGRHELVVTPRRPIAKGGLMRVRVSYAGVPSKASYAGMKPWQHDAHGAAAVNEPEIAPWWYPANDHPRDKATYDVRVRVARSLQVIGNGRLVSRAAHGGSRVWHWRERRPMAPYLAFFVAGHYAIASGRTSSGLPWVDAAPAGKGSRKVLRHLGWTRRVIRWESRMWGPYPFDAIGGVAAQQAFGFALEDESRPVYSRGFIGSRGDIYVLVHENAHQWFGDSVSVHDWKDIWLNEGFATFVEWMWSEQHGGASAQQTFATTYAEYRGDKKFWKQQIGNPGKHHEFDDPVYDRGAMTLQALRNKVGDSAFFTTMRRWAAEHRYGNGSIPQFIALAEQVSGKDLSAFFRTWLYTGSRPPVTAANGFPANFAQLEQQGASAYGGSGGVIQRADRVVRRRDRGY